MPAPVNSSDHGGCTDARQFSRWSFLARCLLAIVAVPAPLRAVTPAGPAPLPLESPAATGPASPWSFNLTPYAWLTGVTGNYRVGPKSKSVDVNFIDIAENLSSVPLAFMGRTEAHWQRLGFYLEGVYSDLTFSERTGPRGIVGVGLSSQLGILDYGVMYRLAGPSPAEQIAQGSRALPNRLDLYVGGRTFWLTNTLDPQRLGSVSAGATLTAPVIGGRFAVDFGPDWFLMADGNVGGFGADQVSFTGSVQGMVGYRFCLAAVPTAVELGYRALRVTTQPASRVETSTTLNGPFFGITTWW